MKSFGIYILLAALLAAGCPSRAQDYGLVHFGTEDGGEIEAAFFRAAGRSAVVLAHGAVFNKESWYPLAGKLQEKGVAALAIDFRGYGNSRAGSTGKKSYDIIGAVYYLRQQGYTDIAVIAGSMGGAATLEALRMIRQPVARVVLLAPAGGPALQAKETDKLFVVSKQEGMYQQVVDLYEQSAIPKKLAEFEGSAHAQHLFNSEHAAALEKLILGFIVNPD